jgi:hypothetical protein
MSEYLISKLILSLLKADYDSNIFVFEVRSLKPPNF